MEYPLMMYLQVSDASAQSLLLGERGFRYKVSWAIEPQSPEITPVWFTGPLKMQNRPPPQPCLTLLFPLAWTLADRLQMLRDLLGTALSVGSAAPRSLWL